MNDQFARIEKLIGEEKFRCIQNACVMVLGLGGVGGYAVEALARSGVGTLVLVDSDDIDITNLNRQIIALKSTIGQKKTDAFEQRIKEINPNAKVIKVNRFIDKDNLSQLFSQPIDYVIDAIDTMTTKVFLWKYCQENQIPVIASLGTAKRIDPSRLKVTKLKKTENDPMAKALRTIARKNDVSLDVDVVYSDETPLNHDQELGSMIFVPSMAGMLCAQHVIVDIMKQVVENS